MLWGKMRNGRYSHPIPGGQADRGEAVSIASRSLWHKVCISCAVSQGTRLLLNHKNLAERAVTGNPDHRKPEQIHAEAWAIVEPGFQRSGESAWKRYQDSAHSETATDDVETIIQAACMIHGGTVYCFPRDQFGAQRVAAAMLRYS
jgi:hypothetical protein